MNEGFAFKTKASIFKQKESILLYRSTHYYHIVNKNNKKATKPQIYISL
ncbi:hypothetical protein HMPREF3202_00289 [Prevotella bivia]|uniref:Uncharacterized protein n=1 Tax=Prevotella bivia TaxID=28125 RepID=A0A137T0F1_9BACT|nr:hypothetical protein HMPREF3202_00289 [Prevotella bivia]